MTADAKMVYVEWVDSHVDADWQEVTDVVRVSGQLHALTVRTIGFLLIDAADYIVVASSYAAMPSGKPLVGCTTQIPRCAITEMRNLRRNGSLH